ncbi:MAG: hypothetical protein QOG39_1857, partial [Acidimicrobiaceae bacterium]
MSEQRTSEGRETEPAWARPDPDRAWWTEPDPVVLFATGLELALRQHHVEVAGLRAERDGLRLEVEGLRAKLAIAQEQLAARDGIGETVRQLQAVVARLTIGRPDIALRVDDAPLDLREPAAPPAPITPPMPVPPPAPAVVAPPAPAVVAPPAPAVV